MRLRGVQWGAMGLKGISPGPRNAERSRAASQQPLHATQPLKPGPVVCHKNAIAFESFGIIVREVDGRLTAGAPRSSR